MKKVKLHDKSFEIYLSEERLKHRIIELAQQINKDYKGKTPVVLSILNGSFIFTADLVRYFNFPLNIEFIRYSSYHGTTSAGTVTKLFGMKSDIKDKDIIIIEDIIDTGLTLSEAIKDLQTQSPKSIKVVSLLVKPDALKYEVQKDYIGFNIPNDFVVGYGLDYDELGRDLPAIYKLA
jgi:hypoxanthine phosphoribosyltransferase